jgi:hypothetical protein
MDQTRSPPAGGCGRRSRIGAAASMGQDCRIGASGGWTGRSNLPPRCGRRLAGGPGRRVDATTWPFRLNILQNLRIYRAPVCRAQRHRRQRRLKGVLHRVAPLAAAWPTRAAGAASGQGRGVSREAQRSAADPLTRHDSEARWRYAVQAGSAACTAWLLAVAFACPTSAVGSPRTAGADGGAVPARGKERRARGATRGTATHGRAGARMRCMCAPAPDRSLCADADRRERTDVQLSAAAVAAARAAARRRQT